MAEATVSLGLRVPAADSDLRSALRTATRAHHERLDAALPLVSPQLTTPRYHQLVQRFYGLYSALEAYFERAVETIPSLRNLVDARRKAPVLAADLGWLGDTSSRITALPHCEVSHLTQSPAAALGAMYVTEGATLGGQLISRHLEQCLGLRGGYGYAFFLSYGNRVSVMWRGFLDTLRRYDSVAARPAIVAGAVDTFDTIERWFNADPPARPGTDRAH